MADRVLDPQVAALLAQAADLPPSELSPARLMGPL
jgi:hypothetical protein